MKISVKYDNAVFTYNLSEYKEEIKKRVINYLKGGVDSGTDETGTGAFWDLAWDIIRDKNPYLLDLADTGVDMVQDEIYNALKKYAVKVVEETLNS